MKAPPLPEHAPFFEHLSNGRLTFPFCMDCGRPHWYPKPRCPHCLSSRIEWRAVAGHGRVYSFTTVHHAFDEQWRDALPYMVALVTFEDAPGVRLVTNLIGTKPEDAFIGMVVEPVPHAAGTPPDRILFRPVTENSA